MKNNIFWVILIILFGCHGLESNNEPETIPLQGDWCFLDKYGNYNEAFFGDSTYRTYNKYVVEATWFRYDLRNDSLYSSVDKRYEGLSPIAQLVWMNNSEVVFITEFTMDTLYRMVPEGFLLSNTEPGKDTTFASHFINRYERFLITKGIITKEEAEDFRKNSVMSGKDN